MPSPMRLLIAAVLVAVAFVSLASTAPRAIAQTQPLADNAAETAEDESRGEALQRLRQRIADPEEREQLLRQIDALIALRSETANGEPVEPEGMLERAMAGVDDLAARLSRFLVLIEAVPELPGWLAGVLTEADARTRWLDRAVSLLTSLAVGLGLFVAVLLGVRGSIRTAHSRARADWPQAAPLARALVMLLPAAVAFAGVLVFTRAFLGPGPVSVLAVALAGAFALSQALLGAAGECLAPRVGRPLPSVDDPVGANTLRWLRIVGVFTICGLVATAAADELGVAPDTVDALQQLVALIVVLALAAAILRFRSPVAAFVRRDAPAGGVRERLSRLWHVIVLVLLAGLYIANFVGGANGATGMLASLATTLVVLVVTLLLDSRLKRGIDRFVDGGITRMQHYRSALKHSVSALVYVLGLLALLQTWGVPLVHWLRTPGGRSASVGVLSVILILVLAVLALELATAITERALQRQQGVGPYGAGNARRQTLLPLVRNIIRITVITVAGLMILAQLGVNIAPLLAGAGVIGLAVGFGAQTLVKDVITGFFMLVEDTVSAGDWVDLGSGHSGEVESLSIRSVRLRDLEGNVHTVPFGDVGTVVNMTRLYSYALIDVRVGYREDVDRVIELLGETARIMRDDDRWGAKLISDIEIFGLQELNESWVGVRVRLKTRPGDQWQVRREFFRRTKLAFEQAGIDMPYPQRTLHFAGPQDEPPPPTSESGGGAAGEPPPRSTAPNGAGGESLDGE
ncbi:mechanosensitive ion channel domain-containing protein [Arhodomonas sp. AD133]|uniref:mechanosensitive ion channel domain-containing protein n=1 Tax=Arhodomonas sp. AD133 TaxID=3415009 RepID=UPI003EC08C20